MNKKILNVIFVNILYVLLFFYILVQKKIRVNLNYSTEEDNHYRRNYK